MLRDRGAALALAGFVVFGVWGTWSEWSSRGPPRQEADRAEHDQGHNDTAVIASIRAWVHDNRDDIGAVSTAVIAFFTITIWWSTRREAQLTRDAIALGNKEFISTHRPRLRVRKLRLIGVQDHPIKVEYDVINVGVGIAKIVHHELRVTIKEPANRISLDRGGTVIATSEGGEGLVGKSLIGGRGFIDSFESDIQYGDWYRFGETGGYRLIFSGIFEYEDDNGVSRYTEFNRTYDAKRDRFVRPDDPDYEYED